MGYRYKDGGVSHDSESSHRATYLVVGAGVSNWWLNVVVHFAADSASGGVLGEDGQLLDGIVRPGCESFRPGLVARSDIGLGTDSTKDDPRPLGADGWRGLASSVKSLPRKDSQLALLPRRRKKCSRLTLL